MTNKGIVFDDIVVTAPSKSIAKQYERQFFHLQTKVENFKNIRFHCVEDPEFKRVGSGGGTMNVLDYLAHQHGIDTVKSLKVLVFHSGGESRRSPIHSVCGKGWASIHAIIANTDLIANPLVLLILEISSFFESLPVGSLVIACCDVILDICKDTYKVVIPSNSVSVISVPVNINIAKNHGVLVLQQQVEQQQEQNQHESKQGVNISIASNYLQKPSIQELYEHNAIFKCDNDDNLAMIDTGVVVFTGKAYHKLVDLVFDPDISCSTAGKVFNDCNLTQEENTSTQSLQLDLYADILYSYSLSQGDQKFSQFINRLQIPSLVKLQMSEEELCSYCSTSNNIYERALWKLWTIDHKISLHVISIFDGIFIHLGSSKEFLEMLTYNTNNTVKSQKEMNLETIRSKYGCNQHICSITSKSISNTIENIVLIGNIFQSDCILSNTSFLSQNCLIEYSVLSGTIDIKSNSILSHITDEFGKDIKVENNMVIQQICIQESILSSPKIVNKSIQINRTNVQALLVAHIVFSIHDDIKATLASGKSSICDIPWNQFFQITGLTADEIWPNIIETNRSVWTAKLFLLNYPISISSSLDLTGLYSNSDMIHKNYRWNLHQSTWIQHLSNSSNELLNELKEFIIIWKDSIRLSLADILEHSNSFAMDYWREYLLMSINHRNHEVFDPVAFIPRPFTNNVTYSQDYSKVFESSVILINSYLSSLSDSDNDHVDSSISINNVNDNLKPRDVLSLSILLVLATLSINIFLSKSYSHTNDIVSSKISPFINEFMYLIELRTSTNHFPSMDTIVFVYERLSSLSPDEAMNVILAIRILVPIQDRYLLVHRLLSKTTIDMIDCKSYPRLLFICGWLVKDMNSGFESIEDKNHISQSISCLFSNSIVETSISLSNESINMNPTNNSADAQTLSEFFEYYAQKLVSFHIQNSLKSVKISYSMSISSPKSMIIVPNRMVLVTAPARIDLAGGWSDTPPICYDIGGLVMNVAINIDGNQPIRCISKFLPNEPIIRLKSIKDIKMKKSVEGIKNYESIGDIVICENDIDCQDVSSPTRPCALLKAVLISLGIVNYIPSSLSSESTVISLKDRLLSIYGGGIEIATISYLPVGSGLGGSSIVAAAALKSVSTLIGQSLTNDELIDLVSHTEQIMTTGGGWQDQVGAVYPGFKVTSSEPLLPLTLRVEPLLLPKSIVSAFEERTFLIYTGQQRLAKNAVINALRRYALTPSLKNISQEIDTKSIIPSERDHIILRLIEGARTGHSHLLKWSVNTVGSDNTIEESVDDISANQAIDELAYTLKEYWGLKRTIAAGSEPNHIKSLLSAISSLCSGYSLAGAGGGGFAVVILKSNITERELHMRVSNYIEENNIQENLRIHRVGVDLVGLNVKEMMSNDEVENVEDLLSI